MHYVGPTSARVIMTARTDAILYRRRLIHSEAAGIATPTATMMREALDILSGGRIRRLQAQLTDVAPDRHTVNGIGAPYDSVYAVGQTPKGCPDHKEAGARVPCLQVPGQGNDDQDGSDEG